MDENTNGTLEAFTKELAEELQASMDYRYGIHVELEPHFTLKTNVEKLGLVVHFEDSDGERSRLAPTIYTEELFKQYQGGMSVRDIADRISEVVFDAYEHSPEIPNLTIDEARQHITLTLVNTAQNEQLLEKTPHFSILEGELSVIPRWYLSDDASFVVNNDMAAQLQLTPDEVLQMGQQHIDSQQFTVQSMQEVLGEMLGEDMMDDFPPMDGPQMMILSSESRIQGSNALLSDSALDMARSKLGLSDEDVMVILPSSLHEVICLKADESMDPDELRAMVFEVNHGGTVAPEDVLSDKVLCYDGRKLSLVGESFSMDTPEIDTPEMDRRSIKMVM